MMSNFIKTEGSHAPVPNWGRKKKGAAPRRSDWKIGLLSSQPSLRSKAQGQCVAYAGHVRSGL